MSLLPFVSFKHANDEMIRHLGHVGPSSGRNNGTGSEENEMLRNNGTILVT